MTTFEWITLIVAGVSSVLLPAGFFIWRQLAQIRMNDLRHIDEQLQSLETRLTRIEAKLDEHIFYHLGHP